VDGFLSKSNRPKIEGIAGPNDFSFFAHIFQIGKFLSATRTGGCRLHFDEPANDTFLMKDMLTVGIGGPNDRFLDRITSQTNGTTIGHQFAVWQFQLTRSIGGLGGVGTGFEIVVVLFYDIRGRVLQNQIFRLDRL
jgi:hypothetical protein